MRELVEAAFMAIHTPLVNVYTILINMIPS
ncbi:hypothetical protein Rruber_04917 [Rhodococcus ruber]